MLIFPGIKPSAETEIREFIYAERFSAPVKVAGAMKRTMKYRIVRVKRRIALMDLFSRRKTAKINVYGVIAADAAIAAYESSLI